jgi:tetratricopeptide (TPR) repeat protein
MAASPKIFLSLCPGELHAIRGTLRQRLARRGVSIFPEIAGALDDRAQLEARLRDIAASDIVIHVVGQSHGPEPSPDVLAQTLAAWNQASPGLSQRLGLNPGDRVSYAQLEVRLAYALGKSVHPVMLDNTFPCEGSQDDFQARRLQHAHRKVFENMPCEMPRARGAFELYEFVQNLDLPGVRPPSKFNYRRPLLLAGALALAAAGWFAWSHFGGLRDSRDPEELAVALVTHTMAHDQAGVITTAEQRYARAEEVVAAEAKIPVADLRKTIASWAKSVCAAPSSSDADRAVAEFAMKDYAKAETSALRATPKGPEQDMNKVPLEERRSVLVAFCAQIAQERYGAAALSMFTHGFESAEQPTSLRSAAQQRYDLSWRHAFVRSLSEGTAGGVWHVILGNESLEPDFRFPADEVIALKSREAADLAALGKLDEAVPLARHLPEEYERLYGREHPSVAIAMENYASILQQDGQFHAAFTQISQMPAIPVPANTESGAVMNYYQSSLIASRISLATGNPANAEKQARFVATERERLLGKEHHALAEALSQLALALQVQGKFAEAEKCQQRAMEIQEKCFGLRGLPSTLGQRRLALIWKDMGNLEKANTTLRECLRVQKQQITEDNPEIAEAHAVLAESDYQCGYIDDAIEHGLKAVELIQRRRGTEVLQLAPIYLTLAKAIWMKKDADGIQEAWSYAMQALKLQEATKNLYTPLMALTLEELGRMTNSIGRQTEAESYLQRAVRLYMTGMRTGHPAYPLVMHVLARNLCDQKRVKEAIDMHVDANNILKGLVGEDHWQYAIGLNQQALTLHDMGQFNEADELVDQAQRILASTLGDNHWRTMKASRFIAQWKAEKTLRAILSQGGQSPEATAERIRQFQQEQARQKQQVEQPKKPTAMRGEHRVLESRI